MGGGEQGRGRDGSGGSAGIKGRTGDGTDEVNTLGHHATWLGSTPCPHGDVGPSQYSSRALRHAHPGKPAHWTSLKCGPSFPGEGDHAKQQPRGHQCAHRDSA